MMLHKPTIIVKRLIVKRRKNIAYDEAFHSGVNVIRGSNSSGKSTVMNFLFYGLGGDLSDWSEVALLCTDVWIEVELNGNAVTLRREITQSAMAPMEFFSGIYSNAIQAPIESWKKHPYRRSANIESFSQVLFRLLEMPDVALEDTGNITIHQVLRLLYADQLSPVDEIFRQDGQDFPIIRETVGNLLCGAFSNEIYEFQQLLKRKEKAYQTAATELRSISAVLSGSDENTGLDWVNAKKSKFVTQREDLLVNIADAESEFFGKRDADKLTLKSQNNAYKAVQTLQFQISELRNRISEIEFDISDSHQFITSLKNKMISLRETEDISKMLDTVHFASCPACYAEIEELTGIAACHLCKTPLDKEKAQQRIAGLINDAAIQIKQSERLQTSRKVLLQELQSDEKSLVEKWKSAAKELQALQILPTSVARKKIRELHRELGYLDRTIEDMDDKIKLAERLHELREKKLLLNDQIERLKAKIDAAKNSQLNQLQRSRGLIERETIDLLKHDLRRQDSFENPENIYFSFAKNELTVDGQTYFSASSRVVLKSSFLLGFLAAAIKDKSMRHPRFLMIDITEDKGMEVERSQNFQHQIMRISESAIAEHQIIFATAMPSAEISDEDLIGKFSHRDDGSLNILQ